MHSCPDALRASRATRRPKLEIAQIARRFSAELSEQRSLSFEQRKALRDIERCRTAALGGYLEVCDHCGHKRPAYKSCRNRHCPKCQWIASQKWLDNRLQRVLPVHHFHVVFTLPAELRSLVMANKKVLCNLLFKSASSALLRLGRDDKRLGATLGIMAVLHTWSRDLSPHPHLHCVVTGGGLSAEKNWVGTAPGFLFPRDVLSPLFRGIFLDGLKSLYRDKKLVFSARCEKLRDQGNFQCLLDKLYSKKFSVFCKAPFDGLESVFAYLGRYTHKTAISDARLISIDDKQVVFRTRDSKTASLPPLSFLSRFINHVLPIGFVRIRHYGLYAAGNVNSKLPMARSLLESNIVAGKSERTQDPDPRSNDSEQPDYIRRYRIATGVDLARCPLCRIGHMHRFTLMIQNHPASTRAPPKAA